MPVGASNVLSNFWGYTVVRFILNESLFRHIRKGQHGYLSSCWEKCFAIFINYERFTKHGVPETFEIFSFASSI